MSDRAIARALVWFRRDLRDFDHAALHRALRDARQVYCAFVFDREILDALPSRADRRVRVHPRQRRRARRRAARDGRRAHRPACARQGRDPGARRRARRRGRLREPRLRARGAAIATPRSHARSPTCGISFRTHKDQVIFERDEVLTQAGNAVRRLHAVQERMAQGADARPPAVLPGRAPRRRARRARRPRVRRHPLARVARVSARPTSRRAACAPGMDGGAALFADFRERIDRYRDARDFPAAKGPSYLSVHLRFGTVSIRELAAYAHMRSLEPDGEGRGHVAVGADLARVLRADPVAPPARRRARVQARVRCARISRTIRRSSPRGATGAPAIRSSTPRCARSTRPATCTTGCG